MDHSGDLHDGSDHSNGEEKMKLVSIFRNIFAGIAVLVILSAIMCLVMHYEPAVVMSGSMEPTFHTGSMVLIDRDSAKNLRVGDTIAFNTGGAFVTHRIVGENDGDFVTKGDANDTADPWSVSTSDVKGKVVLSIPTLGYIIKFIASAPGLIVIACIIICCGLSALLEPTATVKSERKMTSASS